MRAGPVIVVKVLPSVFVSSSSQTCPISVVTFSPDAAIVSSVKHCLQTSFLQEVDSNKSEPTATSKNLLVDIIEYEARCS